MSTSEIIRNFTKKLFYYLTNNEFSDKKSDQDLEWIKTTHAIVLLKVFVALEHDEDLEVTLNSLKFQYRDKNDIEIIICICTFYIINYCNEEAIVEFANALISIGSNYVEAVLAFIQSKYKDDPKAFYLINLLPDNNVQEHTKLRKKTRLMWNKIINRPYYSASSWATRLHGEGLHDMAFQFRQYLSNLGIELVNVCENPEQVDISYIEFTSLRWSYYLNSPVPKEWKQRIIKHVTHRPSSIWHSLAGTYVSLIDRNINIANQSLGHPRSSDSNNFHVAIAMLDYRLAILEEIRNPGLGEWLLVHKAMNHLRSFNITSAKQMILHQRATDTYEQAIQSLSNSIRTVLIKKGELPLQSLKKSILLQSRTKTRRSKLKQTLNSHMNLLRQSIREIEDSRDYNKAFVLYANAYDNTNTFEFTRSDINHMLHLAILSNELLFVEAILSSEDSRHVNQGIKNALNNAQRKRIEIIRSGPQSIKTSRVLSEIGTRIPVNVLAAKGTIRAWRNRQ
jgi:hypothetical protein